MLLIMFFTKAAATSRTDGLQGCAATWGAPPPRPVPARDFEEKVGRAVTWDAPLPVPQESLMREFAAGGDAITVQRTPGQHKPNPAPTRFHQHQQAFLPTPPPAHTQQLCVVASTTITSHMHARTCVFPPVPSVSPPHMHARSRVFSRAHIGVQCWTAPTCTFLGYTDDTRHANQGFVHYMCPCLCDL